jgi:hypothetical protein
MKEYITREAVESTHHLQDSHDIESIIASATEVSSFDPYCYPLDIPVDQQQLLSSLDELVSRLGFTYKEFTDQMEGDFIKKYESLGNPTRPIAWDVNLSHMPELTGITRWRSFRGTVDWIREEGGDPKLSTTLLTELDGLYIKDIIESILARHQQDFSRPFTGQVTILWVGVNQRYNLHNDSNLHLRYHVPLYTDESVKWVFQDMVDHTKYYKMHMSAGKVWQLNPVDIVHTVVNKWDTPRAHLVLSEFK